MLLERVNIGAGNRRIDKNNQETTMTIKKTAAAILACGLLFAQGAVRADEVYPQQTIHLVVGFPPGGGGDLYGRVIASQLTQILGKTVIVDNKPGAGGLIAAEVVAKSKPDGYTLLLAMSGNLATAPAIRRHLSYKSPDDFAAISLVAEAPQGLIVAANSKYHTVQDLLVAAKSGKLSYGSTGTGSAAQIGMEIFKQRTHADILHIPYKGSGPALNDLMSGRIDTFFATYPPLMGQIKGGSLRVLASTAATRNPQLPDVPTMHEAGVDMTLTQWYGIVAPAGTPRAVTDKLAAAIQQALKNKDVLQIFEREGVTPGALTGDAFRQYIVDDIARYKDAVAVGHIPME
jgi:tripartite-type tricarboxylate transporter receptor subunit TctC